MEKQSKSGENGERRNRASAEGDDLVNGKEQLAARMNSCNKVKYLGPSSKNEILGFTYPDKYPLINKNSNSRLRFFGYRIKD